MIEPGSSSADALVGTRTRVYVYGKDPILRAGVASQLRRSPTVAVASDYSRDSAGVAVVVADEIGDEAAAAIRAIRRSCTPRIVVVATNLTFEAAATAFEVGACGFLLRSEARPDQLVAAVKRVATTDPSSLPASLGAALGELADCLQPEAPASSHRPALGLSARHVEILRRMADGEGTGTIARDLGYSDSTIKNNVHDIVHQLQATNRVHAVAIALRAGLI
ncbi:MAG TPA: LuxR C-terminal-related transcriptional regulator [Acidimicrobiales bacterium]